MIDPVDLPNPPEGASDFDYSALAPDVSKRLRQGECLIFGMGRKSLGMAVQIGRELIIIRKLLPRRTFERWIRKALAWNTSAAYRYIKMVEVFGDDDLATLHALPVTLVQDLARDIVPGATREGILRRAAAGEVLRSTAVREEMKADVKLNQSLQAGAEQRSARRIEESRRRQERSLTAARALIAMIGADRARTYITVYVDVLSCKDVLPDALAAVEIEAQRQCAESVEVTDLPVDQIVRDEPIDGTTADPEDAAKIEALANSIEFDGGVCDPPIVLPSGGDGRYRVIRGADTVRALADVLGKPTIAVRIVPPLQDVPLTPAGETKPQRIIIAKSGVPSSIGGTDLLSARNKRRLAAKGEAACGGSLRLSRRSGMRGK